MVGFDQSDIAASLALGRAVAKEQALQAEDLGETPCFAAVVGTPGSSYLVSMIDVPGHHGDNGAELESVNMPVPISLRGMMDWVFLEQSP